MKYVTRNFKSLFIFISFFVSTFSYPVLYSEHQSYDQLLQASATHLKKQNLDDALYYLKKAIAVRPEGNQSIRDCAVILFQLGNEFFDHKQPKKAIEAFKTILIMAGNFAAVYHNIAFTLAEKCGRYRESIEWYRTALEHDPNNVATHFCLALSLLAVGKLHEGFEEYEWRWLRDKKSPRNFTWPLDKLWNGIENVQGKRILLRVEQGLGDTLQFIRYAQLLKHDGAIVIAEVQRPLIDILALCDYIDELIVIGSPIPAFDLQIPMLNLPSVYKTTLETVPAHIPYLFADKNLVAFWKKQLTHNTNFKIGICWHGDLAHSTDKFMPLNMFAQLADIPGISIYSLQRFNGLDQLKTLENKQIIRSFDDTFDKNQGRFMDTAAVIKNLDLVITVDTSIAHLAGGLGVPVWVVLPFPAEWRWLEDRDDNPWYPTARIFRRKEIDTWQSVMDKIYNELRIILSH